MMLTLDERELLEMAWDDWIGLCEIYPQITIHHHDGRIVEIPDPVPGLKDLLGKGLINLCFYTAARREYRPVATSDADELLGEPVNWEGSEDREVPRLGFEITEKGRELMEEIWTEENKRD